MDLSADPGSVATDQRFNFFSAQFSLAPSCGEPAFGPRVLVLAIANRGHFAFVFGKDCPDLRRFVGLIKHEIAFIVALHVTSTDRSARNSR